METVCCSNCGNSKEVYPSRLDKENHFCDRECYGEWRSENVNGENHPQADRVTVECAWCETKKQIPRSRAEGTRRHFCSTECEAEWKSINLQGERNPNWQSTEVNCSSCSTTLTVVSSRSKAYENLFCGEDCYAEWKSENVRGKSHPNWSGGFQHYYGKTWLEMRNRVRERDGNICRRCGTDSTENGRNLPVHHIVPVREFDDPNKAHTMENMIQVCDSCHMIVEQLPVEVQKEMFM